MEDQEGAAAHAEDLAAEEALEEAHAEDLAEDPEAASAAIIITVLAITEAGVITTVLADITVAAVASADFSECLSRLSF